MAKVCPKAINFATAELIHQLLALRPHPNENAKQIQKNFIDVDGEDGFARYQLDSTTLTTHI